MSVLYEGVKNSRQQLAARHSRRTRVLFAALAVLVFALFSAVSSSSLNRLGLGAGLLWLMSSLGLRAWFKALERRGRLGMGMVAAYGVDLAFVAAFAWLLGADPWVSAFGISTVLAAAGLYLNERGVRAVLVMSLVILALLLAAPHLAWLAPPSGAVFAVRSTGSLAWVTSFTALGVLFLSGFASLRFSGVSSQHESELRQANQRLRGLYEALSDQQFSLLVSQQDLLLANERLKQKSEEVLKSQDVIRTLAQALEARDVYTQGHSSRVADAALMLAREIGLSREEQDIVRLGCLLHDLGKINIPDAVLLKPGSLTDEEYGLMQRHPVVGEQICRPLVFARSCLTVIRHHHERWDGNGYPDKLKGDEISLFARIASIADSWDAMTTDRPYRKALAAPVAFSILEDGAGTQWDPGLVPAFIRVMSHHVDQRATTRLEEGER